MKRIRLIHVVKVEVLPGVEVEGSFSMTRTTELGLQNPCTDVEGYSFTACISSYVDTQVLNWYISSISALLAATINQAGCAIPWLTNVSSVPSCATSDAIKKHYGLEWTSHIMIRHHLIAQIVTRIKHHRLLGLVKAMSLSSLYSKTGCLPKCAQTKYKFNLKKSTPINWRSSSISSFYLTAESDQVEEQVEYLVYDMQVCKSAESK